MDVVTVVGARPQFVKAAVVSAALAEAGITERLVHTGQHYDAGMSQIFFDELGIPAPSSNLGVGSGSHGKQTAAMLAGIEEMLLAARPDWLVVYGDTNSTIAGALAAAKLGVPVAHVEAGLRSFNRAMPEELNRVATDHLSDLLLAPTGTAVAHLATEGITGDKVRQVGDVMCDAARVFGAAAKERSRALERLGLEEGGYALLTAHRAENVDRPERLAALVAAMEAVAAAVPVVCPLHPRTAGALERAGLTARFAAAVTVAPPQGFLDMLRLESAAAVIATDSGGVQKEAFFAGVPCVTLRTETEWVELVEAGWNRLAPLDGSADVAQVVLAARGSSGAAVAPYGDGHASARIAAALAERRA